MTVNETLATYSNYLVYGAMAAYTIAMIAFAVSFAAMRGRDLVPAASVPAGTEVDSGAVAVATKVATTVGGPDDGALPPGRRAGNIGMSTTWLGTTTSSRTTAPQGLEENR